ncbi:MAG TPA: molybdopterin-dependent oxidoreductase, partial [Croceibacterium sp.]|nr:molybdopterin-dependent oxidoreductase [Croceibacterium sp.]
EAKFIVFRCADTLDGAPYYESVDLVDAYHPQTIVAHSLNGAPLPEANGAPLRMRIERQLGYKHAKFLTGVEAVASLDDIAGGKGGYWEDRGYQWYAGI